MGYRFGIGFLGYRFGIGFLGYGFGIGFYGIWVWDWVLWDIGLDWVYGI